MPRINAFILTAVLLLASSRASSEPPLQSVAFVVSPAQSARNLSLGDLRRIYLGQITRWRDGHRIVPLVAPPDVPESRIFLDRVVRMSDIDYSHFWIGAVFRGEAAVAPRLIESRQAMLREVAQNPDAIGFVLDGSIRASSVIVLTIDDRAPGTANYPVRQ